MPAEARAYAYIVEIKKDARKPEPTISLEMLKQYQKDIEKYVSPENCVGKTVGKTVEVAIDKTPFNGYNRN